MKLDEYQKAAVVNDDKKVLLIAPPGSGKTTVLIEKILHLVNIKNVDPERIFVLTFSRSAAENIKKRVKLKNIEGPFFGTIHSLAYRNLTGREGKRLIGEKEAGESIKPLLKRYHIPSSEASEYLGIISAMKIGKEPEGSYSSDFLKELKNTYEREKKELNAFDFDDLMDDFLVFLDTAEGEKLSFKAQYILVDEFQDLNGIQLEILSRLSGTASLFCVGDEDQCIYSFRGSETLSMVGFERFFPGGIKLYLKYNYRSSLSVINYANRIIEKNRLRNNKKILSFRSDLKELELLIPSDEDDCLRKILEITEKSHKTEKIALLFRTNMEMDFYMEKFIKMDIGFSLLDRRYNFFERGFYKGFFSFFRAGIPGRKDDFLKVLKILKYPGRIIKKVSELSDISEDRIRRLNLKNTETEDTVRLLRCLADLRNKKPSHAFDYIYYILGYIEFVRNMSEKTGRDMAEYTEDFIELKKRTEGFETYEDLEVFISAWNSVYSDKPGETGKVILGTLHSVKGMEFDRVIIMNCVEGIIPHEKSGNDREGERRLFYVGVTRAENELYIMSPESIGGKKKETSVFLKETEVDPP